MLRLSAFRQVGGYRELLGFGCEDTELAWRLIAAGFEVWEEPGYTILHDHTPIARDYGWEEWHYARNTVLMHALNRTWPAGFALGTLKGIRRAMISRCRWSAAAGLAAGILGALLHSGSPKAIPSRAWPVINHE